MGVVTHGEPTLEQVYPGGLQPVEGSTLEQLVKDYSLWERLALEQWKSVKRKERDTGTVMIGGVLGFVLVSHHPIVF